MKNEPESNGALLWLSVSMVLAFSFLMYYSNRDKRFLELVKEHPKYTINKNDTTYVISSKIDSAYYDPQRNDPEDR